MTAIEIQNFSESLHTRICYERSEKQEDKQDKQNKAKIPNAIDSNLRTHTDCPAS